MRYKKTVVILAAGQGTRMKSDLPKVLHPIAGRAMVLHVLDMAAQLDTQDVHVVVSPNQPKVREVIHANYPQSHVVEQPQQLGTAHAVSCGVENVELQSDVTIILYGDTPFVREDAVNSMVQAIMAEPELAVAVLGFTAKDPTGYGRLVAIGDRLEKIVEHKEASPEELMINLCNSGVVAVKTAVLSTLLGKIDNQNAKGEYYLTDIVAIARKEGYQATYIATDEQEVMGVNSQIERAEAEAVMQQQLRHAAMEQGVMMIDPNSVMLSKDTQYGRNVVIHPHVVISDGVQIADDVEIKAFSHLQQCKIGQGSVIGPYARLRPGAELESHVHIGNFVEVKKSVLEQGVKVNHLSYIGDAEIGSKTNIGAGTVTCNYDGYNKHLTSVESGVFIGSNSSLVAPVTVGKGAIIAAGSTVISDVPSDAIMHSDMKQKHRENTAEQFRTVKRGKS